MSTSYKSTEQFYKEQMAEIDHITQEDRLVVKPSHYERYAIEPINFIMTNDLEFWRGNIVKYCLRAGFKFYPDMDATQSEITDLRKIIRYAEMRINQLEGKQPNATR